MSRVVSFLAVVFLLASQILSVSAQKLGAPGILTGDGVVVYRADRLIDGTGRPAIEKGAVLVRNNVIEAVGKASDIAVPEGARVIELGDSTLMPGFIDAHTHLIGRVLGDPEGPNARFRDFDSFGAILAVRNAERTVNAGFTTVRNVGAGGFDDLALKKAINEGWIRGPRMITAAHSLGITGGHCDENGYKPGVADGDVTTGIADGVDEVRAAVRYQVKYGADVIKTCATGGVLSEGDAVGVPQYTFEELRAMVEEAEKLERKVAAHAHGTEGIKIATRAGVASIEHGSFLDDEGARLMVEKGTFLVPTLMAGEAVENLTKAGILTGYRGEKALAAAAGMRNMIKIAIRNNVKIALGTDAGVIPHGTNAREFILMVEWGGMDPLKAINAGTLNAAVLLGLDKTIGSLEKGKVADIVAVSGNPIADIRNMERVNLVVKNGAVIKRPGPTP
ncbi:MAG: amidohydrolase family protein [Acidobacteria bacterium]|nr:MAG: amidohydrolase family protein [Acidobacteriota bacterium]REK04162.1 MAG: amidohydrolase family protein [Acidobacteriota bacterium]REK15324.1 MAG: amidohydrolase family protein [Acidobacteriota bacterium]REK46414.1 MAG: amidohydrolase family protein [Acidobacteriota bacterium]